MFGLDGTFLVMVIVGQFLYMIYQFIIFWFKEDNGEFYGS